MAERDMSQGPDGAKPSYTPSFNENPSADYDRPQGPSATAQDTGSGLKQKMSEDVRTAEQGARRDLSQAADTAKDTADRQKNFIAKQLSGFASAVEKVGTEMQAGDQQDIGDMARRLGSGLQTFADDIRDRDLGEVAGMAQDFGRRQPVAFLGIAALAGFAASRFLAASRNRGPGVAVRERPDMSSQMEDRTHD